MPSEHSSGASDGERLTWEEKLAYGFDETTAIACIRGIRCEERAREVLGIINREGVEDSRKACVVGRVRELAGG